MTTCMPRIASITCALGLAVLTGAQDQPPVPPFPAVPEAVIPEQALPMPEPAAADAAATPVAGAVAAPAADAAAAPSSTAVPVATFDHADQLRLNFRAAPIELVLNYLSDAAGFIIQLNTPLKGTLDVWSNQSVTREEAVELLNSVLNRNGYAAIRNGRTLTIMSKDEAMHGDIPVKVGDDPSAIPKNDEIVTQIMALRFVEAGQLVKDLSPLVSPHATIIANEAGNSIVVTDTQANIRHLAEIIKAIDSSAESMTEVRVFRLKHHDPSEIATMLTGLLSDQGSASGSQSPLQLAGFFGRGAGGPFRGINGPAAPAATSNPQQDRIKKQQQVVAVADPRTSSVIVKAAKDIMEQIAGMIAELDQESPGKTQHVSVFHLDNADPQQVQQVLQDMFQSSTSTRSSSATQTSPLQLRIQQNQSGSTLGSGGGTSPGIGTSRSGSGLPSGF